MIALRSPHAGIYISPWHFGPDYKMSLRQDAIKYLISLVSDSSSSSARVHCTVHILGAIGSKKCELVRQYLRRAPTSVNVGGPGF